MPNDPINNIEWVDARQLSGNLYNPNVVQREELALLEFSILKTGWIQPILANRDGMIIDGFHRWLLAIKSPKLRQKYAGRVPVSYLPLTLPEAMMCTIRINRAKGTHVALKMSEIVHRLIRDHGLDPRQIAQNIGANLDEVELLNQDGIFQAKNLDKMPFGKAWVPRAPVKKAGPGCPPTSAPTTANGRSAAAREGNPT